MMSDTLSQFQATIEENITVMTGIYAAVAMLITVGVAYNSARIQLSERARDLASLRILGFTKGEVSYILIGETMLLALLAQPLGWLLGAGLSAIMVAGLCQRSIHHTAGAEPRYIRMGQRRGPAGGRRVSALLVRRRLDNLDLIEVMKTRE